MIPDHRYDLAAPPDAPVAVLVLHPHPDMGGDRYNPVVDVVYREAASRGWAVARFDFSSSDLEVALGEATAALDLLPVAQLGVVGYSFGAAVAARLVDPRIDAWALIAPPFGSHFPAADLEVGADSRPKLLLSPEHDQWGPGSGARGDPCRVPSSCFRPSTTSSAHRTWPPWRQRPGRTRSLSRWARPTISWPAFSLGWPRDPSTGLLRPPVDAPLRELCWAVGSAAASPEHDVVDMMR